MGNAIDTSALGDILRKNFPEEEVTSDQAETATTDTAPVEIEEEVVEDESPITAESEVETEELEEQDQEVDETEEAEETREEYSETEINDLNQLATAIEVEPEFLYNIKVPMADGMEPISLSELKDGYTQFKRGTTADLEILEKQRAEFEEYKQQQVQAIQQQAQLPQEIMAAQAEALSIANQYNSNDWESLEASDPGRAALEKQKIASKYQQAENKFRQLSEEFQQKQAAEFERFNSEQRQNMLKKIPEWRDDKIRTAEQENIRVMLRDYDYSDADINSMADHRAMKLARDLWQLKSKNIEAKKVIKKIAKVPRTLKEGSVVKPVDGGAKQRMRKVKEEAKKSKNLDVKTNAVSSILQSIPRG